MLMNTDLHRLLDDVGWRLLAELQQDARISWAELGRRVGLSTPAVADRVRRLEVAGIITGYHATLNAVKVGLPVTAIVRLHVPGGTGPRVRVALASMPEVFACDHITGEDCFVCTVRVPSIADLEKLLEQLARHGSTTTSVVLSSPVVGRVVGPSTGEAGTTSISGRIPGPARVASAARGRQVRTTGRQAVEPISRVSARRPRPDRTGTPSAGRPSSPR
jgi:Lrp/AsnC family leucine-responsive transcriptional regulator